MRHGLKIIQLDRRMLCSWGVILLSIKWRTTKIKQSRNACQLVPLLRDPSKIVSLRRPYIISKFSEFIYAIFLIKFTERFINLLVVRSQESPSKTFMKRFDPKLLLSSFTYYRIVLELESKTRMKLSTFLVKEVAIFYENKRMKRKKHGKLFWEILVSIHYQTGDSFNFSKRKYIPLASFVR